MRKNLSIVRRYLYEVAVFLFTFGCLWVLKERRRDILPELLKQPVKIGVVCIGGAMLVFVLLMCMLARSQKWRIEKLFLVTYIPISLWMMMVLPVGWVPDEGAHLERIYFISTGQFLTPSDGSGFAMPDNWKHIESNTPISELLEKESFSLNNETIQVSGHENTGIYPINSYFPQAIGMAVAHLFTSNRLVLLYAARLGGWLTTLLLLYSAIKMMPAGGKQILFLIALFPMTLQEGMSAAADGMTIGVVACFVAFILEACSEKKQFSSKDYGCLTLLAICVTTFKVMYIPLLFLLLFIPEKCFGGRKQKRNRVVVILLCAIGVIAFWGLFCKLRYMDDESTRSARNIIPQLKLILRSPQSFALTIIRTLMEEMEFYVMGVIGASLAWFNISLPPLLTFGMLILFVAACGGEIQKARLSAKNEAQWDAVCLGLLLLSFASILVIFVFLYVWWTPYAHDLVEGIQGRYFIPLVLPFVMGLRRMVPSSIASTCSDFRRIETMAAMDVVILAYIFIYAVA